MDEPALQRAVEINRERRTVRHAEAAHVGAAYLVECRDLWDADDADAGVYFVPCVGVAEVTALALEFSDDNPNDRLLGVYRVSEPVAGQGAGLSRAAWLAGAR
ncbi:MAG: hypothetical protein JNL73_15730 [Anaerolineales bacterium]|nr:hypothetical protein [Anaerolineales bacterium]